MAVNKVIYGNEPLIDLTSDSVTEQALLTGYTAHSKSGVVINGSLSFNTIYTGSSAPASSLGSNGDIYMVVK